MPGLPFANGPMQAPSRLDLGARARRVKVWRTKAHRLVLPSGRTRYAGTWADVHPWNSGRLWIAKPLVPYGGNAGSFAVHTRTHQPAHSPSPPGSLANTPPNASLSARLITASAPPSPASRGALFCAPKPSKQKSGDRTSPENVDVLNQSRSGAGPKLAGRDAGRTGNEGAPLSCPRSP